MREVTEAEFFGEIKRLGKAGRDPMPGRGQNSSESIWKDQRSTGMEIVGRSAYDEDGECKYFLV